jgi:hypothetical protein
MVRILWADQDLNYVRVRLRKAWTPRVGQTVEVLVVSNPLFLVTEQHLDVSKL